MGLAVVASAWLPAQATADSGVAAADISAVTSLAQQMTARAEQTGGAALTSAQNTARQAISQAAATTTRAIQGAQQTANAALAQSQSAASSAAGATSPGGGSPGTSPSSGATGSPSSAGSAESTPPGSTTAAPIDSPEIDLPAGNVAVASVDATRAIPAAVATALSRQPLPAAALGTDWRSAANWVSHSLASLGADAHHASPSTGARARRTPPRPPALPGLGARPGPLQLLQGPPSRLIGADITGPGASPVHTSFSRSAKRTTFRAEHAGRQPAREDSTSTAPPAPGWFGPASDGAAAAAGAGGGAGSSSGILVGAMIALLIVLSSGRLSLDLLPLRSKLAASPLERPG